MGDYVEVYVANDVAQAYLVKSLLENEEIETVIENELLEGALGGVPVGGSVSPRILVPAADLDKARACLDTFESSRKGGETLEDGDEEGETPS